MAGRSVRGAAAGVGSCPHLLSAVTHDGQVVLAQRQIPDKGSEISEISELAVLVIELDLAGKVVTVDALCRLRHNASYEDVLVMPMCCPEPQLAARAVRKVVLPGQRLFLSLGAGRIRWDESRSSGSPPL